MTPHSHRFDYRLYFTLFDVERIDEICAASPWWSKESWNLVSFRRRDFIAPHGICIAEAVRDRVEQVHGVRPMGRIFLLTHLRQWGSCFNPVSFYLCLDEAEKLQFLVAEIHNTPWNERHAYVLDARDQPGPDYRFCFDKVFHVSPFLPMELRYDWRFSLSEDSVAVHMLVMDGDSECFGAGMKLALEALSPAAMRRMPLKYPFLTARVVAAIYWQAFRLWLRQTPFFSHPDKQARSS